MQKPHTASIIDLTDRPPRAIVEFSVEPDAEARKEIAQMLGLLGLKKLRLVGQLAPEGKTDWQLTAKLGATASQACVVTLDPVTTRIDTPVARTYVADLAPLPDASEVEMPEDDSIEALPDQIDLLALIAEALAIALPDFPRSEGATLENKSFSAPGVPPLTEADVKPFAALKALKSGSDEDNQS